jgi:transcriptional regulator with XRE-family HTH domain
MLSEQGIPREDAALGSRIHDARVSAGLTPRQLARRSGVSRRKLTAIETGRQVVSAGEYEALAAACDVGPSEPVASGNDFRLVLADRNGSGGVRGEPALDALLREYISMVIELRNMTVEQLNSLRAEDLDELALALGGTPDMIEARIVELLHTTPNETRAVRAAIMPSTAPHSGFPVQD